MAISLLRCGENDLDPSGIVLHSNTTITNTSTPNDLWAYYPLALDGTNAGEDIANDNDATAYGSADITKGKLCEYAEQFRSYRYYKVPEFNYWDGFSFSVLYRYSENNLETTIFSLSPALRVGLSWMAEPVIQATWTDKSVGEAWGEPIDKTKFIHFAFNYKPSDEASIYINGELSCSVYSKLFLSEVQDIFIGKYDNGGYAIGDMQDFRLYNFAKPGVFWKNESDSYNAGFISI